MRFTIEEYSKAYSISPEMVQSRIRRNRLNYIIEDGTTYIVVPKHQVPFSEDDVSSANHQSPPKEETSAPQKKTTVATVIGLYQKENHYLKLRIKELESKVDRLVNEKEQLLKDERARIEKVYMDKDAQLKTILELINTKLLHDNKANIHDSQYLQTSASASTIEANIENSKQASLVELKHYLRTLDLKAPQRKKIKRTFAEAFGSDSRIILKDGLFYLDFDRFDYSDLLSTKV